MSEKGFLGEHEYEIGKIDEVRFIQPGFDVDEENDLHKSNMSGDQQAVKATGRAV